MKVKNRPRSSSLFLMELILAILFFSVASAVCVQIFVKSHLISRQSEELSQAVTLCTNSAEAFAASDARFPEQLIPIMMRSLPFANRPKHPMCKQFTFILIKHKAMGILSALTFHWIQSQILMTTRRRQFIRCIPPVI